MRINKPMFDIFISLGVFAFLGAFIAQIGKVSSDARGYPLFLIICSMLLTAALMFKSVKKYHADLTTAEPGFKKEFLYILEYILMIAAYLFLLDKIGYLLSTLLFVVLSLLFLKVRNWRILTLLPLGLTLSMYFLFTKLLSITLPRGTFITFYL